MFKILQKAFTTGTATVLSPDAQPVISEQFRGKPVFDFPAWRDARPAAGACPTGAIAVRDHEGVRHVTVDYGLCVFCGLCAGATPEGAVRVTREFELATGNRRDLILEAEYGLNADGSQARLLAGGHAVAAPAGLEGVA